MRGVFVMNPEMEQITIFRRSSINGVGSATEDGVIYPDANSPGPLVNVSNLLI